MSFYWIRIIEANYSLYFDIFYCLIYQSINRFDKRLQLMFMSKNDFHNNSASNVALAICAIRGFDEDSQKIISIDLIKCRQFLSLLPIQCKFHIQYAWINNSNEHQYSNRSTNIRAHLVQNQCFYAFILLNIFSFPILNSY